MILVYQLDQPIRARACSPETARVGSAAGMMAMKEGARPVRCRTPSSLAHRSGEDVVDVVMMLDEASVPA